MASSITCTRVSQTRIRSVHQAGTRARSIQEIPPLTDLSLKATHTILGTNHPDAGGSVPFTDSPASPALPTARAEQDPHADIGQPNLQSQETGRHRQNTTVLLLIPR